MVEGLGERTTYMYPRGSLLVIYLPFVTMMSVRGSGGNGRLRRVWGSFREGS